VSVAKTKLEEAWLHFIQGEWVSTMPTEVGYYPTRTRDGYTGPIIFIYKDKDTGTPTPIQEWKGDWWSRPRPEMPDVKD
jgi:hypothetical protein